MTKYPSTQSRCEADGAALVPEETFAYVDRDLEAGDTVGEYRIEGKLGEGGMGAVFRAVHPLIGKTAAVKVLSRALSSNPQMVSRFIAEARAVNQIRHRNIIDIFSFGQLADGRQYYVMELLDGQTFDAYLAAQGSLTFERALPILKGIARALDAAHAKGILHRDLKPENVFLVFDEDGGVEPKLLDFGLVKLLGQSGKAGEGETTGEHKTKTGTPMGTPYYMSPEQCRGLDVDRRTDIYAFGAVVFEVLTGKVPFDGASSMDILVKHMTAEVPRASEANRNVPVDFDAPLQRILAKEPDARPSSVGEALEILSRAARGELALEDVGRAPTSLDHTPVSSAAISQAIAASSATARRGAAGQTFLGAESDVPTSKPGSRSWGKAIVASAIVVATILGGLGFAMTRQTGTHASGLVVSAAVAPSVSVSATAVPAAPSTAPATAPSAVAREDIELRVDGAPAGATVKIDGKELGAAPGPFKVRRGSETKITILAKGYKSRDFTLTPADDVVVPGALDKASAKPVGGPSIHSDLEGFDNKK